MMELTLCKEYSEFIFLSSIESYGGPRDSFYIYIKQRHTGQNWSLIVSWINFNHKTICTFENCGKGTIRSEPPRCKQNKEFLNLRGELKCLNFSLILNYSHIDYYHILFNVLRDPARYFSWDEASHICQKWNGSLPRFRSKIGTVFFSKMLKLSQSAILSETVFVASVNKVCHFAVLCTKRACKMLSMSECAFGDKTQWKVDNKTKRTCKECLFITELACLFLLTIIHAFSFLILFGSHSILSTS